MNSVEEPITSTADVNEALADRFRKGDWDALEDLVRIMEGPLLRIAYRIVGQIADAEEVRQTVLLRLVEAPWKLPADGNFIAWIHRCAVNEALTLIRHRQRSTRLIKNLSRNGTHSTIDPVQPVALVDEVEHMKAALEVLEPEQRALLALRFDEGLTIRGIAEVMEIPHSTVQSQLTKAIAALRHQLRIPN